MTPPILQRSQIANFLGIILLILTLSVGGAGYYTYRSLSEIVRNLETDHNPNTNLYLYKEIVVTLQGMDNLVETYQISEDETFINRYVYSNDKIFDLLDSINSLNNDDEEMMVQNDSLGSLLRMNKDILDQLLLFVNENEITNLDELGNVVSRVTDHSIKPAKKSNESEADINEGLLRKLFSRSQKDKTNEQVDFDSDSLLLAQKRRIQAELNHQVAKIQAFAHNQAEIKRKQEISLEMAHFEVQNQIFDLIGFLESREAVKLQINALKAKELASRTNQQIGIFFYLATALLLSSLIVMLVYVRRNRAYQQLLNESKAATEILAKAKERFFANMSHELRTPMNAIYGFTKILMKSKLSAVQEEQVQIINKSSEHLLTLLNDILDFSKLQAEKLRLESIPFDIKEVCEDCIKLLSDSAHKKGLKLSHISESLPPLVLGDPHRLKQILLNILTNAIKYTESGEISLKVFSQKKEKDFHIHFIVSDTGIGIPEDQKFTLFHEFQQANQSSFSKGTGLGLAITKRLIQLHHGEIEIESKEAQGTRVMITIPYKIADQTEKMTNEPNLHSIEGLKVLIADDELFNIKLLASLLESHGIHFDQAMNGKEALRLAEQNLYDIILLDLKMPELNGWEVSNEIRRSMGPNQKTPIIALTATESKFDTESGEQSGFDSIIRKPFDEAHLFEMIALKTRRHAAKQTKTDLSGLFKMGNKEFVSEMIDTFISSATDCLEELETHLKSNNFEKLSLLSHRLIAPARHFKAEILVKMLHDFEISADKHDTSLSSDDIEEIKEELHRVIVSIRSELKNQS